MSKSTPISTLRNSQPEPEKNEDLLVKEILDEIEQNGSEQQEQGASPESKPAPTAPASGPSEQEIMEQRMMEQRMMEQQMMEQQMMEQQMAENQGIELAPQVDLTKASLQDNIVDLVKMPAIVAGLVLILSLPQVSKVLSNLLPKKEVITKYIDYIIPLIKALVGGGLYFGISKSL